MTPCQPQRLQAAVRLSRLSRTADEHLVAALEPLHDALAMTPAALKALREREAQALTLQLLKQDLDKRQRTAAATTDSKKAASLRDDMAALELAVQAARDELDNIAARNHEELKRWHQGRAVGFARMLVGWFWGISSKC